MTPFPVEDQLALQTIVHDGLAASATPGALVGVWYPGRGTWTYAAGIGDVTTGMPVSLDDHVRIASNTKSFVATVVLQLVDEGALSLDDRLEDHLAGIPSGTEIMLRHLLDMSAGVFDYTFAPDVAGGYSADPLFAFTPDDALDIIRASSPDFAPGERFQYSNSTYILLGKIVEQVTGQPIDVAVGERILTPLGMEETSFPIGTLDLPSPFMRGYDVSAAGPPLRDVTRSNPDLPWAAGAMVSTLTDLGIWAEALGTGSLVSPAMQDERLKGGELAEGNAYGLGIFSLNGLVGHNGGIYGYGSWVMHDLETGASIVVVISRGNTYLTVDPIFPALTAYLFPERFPAS
jgi:D-alanyl-D-alanine carboxypeptidase